MKIWKQAVIVNLVLFIIGAFYLSASEHQLGVLACVCTLAIIEAIEYKEE